ncbi:melatonin receptor type 1B-B-like [Tubulanus polymorphus]|uniref:melatonin receptor type 1B-B-like n=1 Tax=Tubulanus polymorphus TaxID=672921 RepID=UPI003DA3838E
MAWTYVNRTSLSGETFLSLSTLHEVLFGICTLFGIFGNCLLLIAYIIDRKLRTTSNTFIFYVSISDFLFSALLSPIVLASSIAKRNVVNEGTCFAIGMVSTFSFGVSMYGQGLIAFNRYIRVCHHFLYPKIFTRRNVVFMSVGLLVSQIVVIYGSVLVGWCAYDFDDRMFTCMFDWKSPKPCTYILLTTAFIPANSIIFLYMQIFLFIRRANSSRRNTVNRETRNSRTRVIKALFTAFVLLLMMFTPFAIVTIIDNNMSLVGIDIQLRFITFSVFFIPCINPVVYGLMNARYKRSYGKVFNLAKYCLSCKTQVEPPPSSSEQVTSTTESNQF